MRALVLVAALCGVVHADVPWGVGVSAEQQARANKLFAEGNELFAKQAHAPALQKYHAALELWDHPLIRYNMAITLIRLDRILDAADNLDAALRFGAEPFTPSLFLELEDYQRLVAGRVGTIDVRCDQSGVHVALDGKAWFDCPATRRVRVLGGQHQVVAERNGFVTLTRHLQIDGGATDRESLVLQRPRDTAWYQHWYVLAAVGVVAAGTVGYFATRDTRDHVPVTIVPQ
jgi:tetratricopeptide (TPR) repeat protein